MMQSIGLVRPGQSTLHRFNKPQSGSSRIMGLRTPRFGMGLGTSAILTLAATTIGGGLAHLVERRIKSQIQAFLRQELAVPNKRSGALTDCLQPGGGFYPKERRYPQERFQALMDFINQYDSSKPDEKQERSNVIVSAISRAIQLYQGDKAVTIARLAEGDNPLLKQIEQTLVREQNYLSTQQFNQWKQWLSSLKKRP